MKFTEIQLTNYTKPISDSEDQQCKNAIGMVRDALKALGFSDDGKVVSKMFSESSAYQIRMQNSAGKDIKIFVQGSYANGTNIRAESDVDLAVVQEDTFRVLYRSGVTDANYRFVTKQNTDRTLKDEVEDALVAKFGRRDVSRHNKSVHVLGNTYRKEADSVPSMRYRDYSNDYNNNPLNFIGGIIIKADDGTTVINYPEQHIENGILKNKATSFKFKKMVRIMKNIRFVMDCENIASAKKISSFLIESLLWNIPDSVYAKYTANRFVFNELVCYLHENQFLLTSFREINGIKYLTTDDPNRLNQCRAFIDDLKKFYEYDITE